MKLTGSGIGEIESSLGVALPDLYRFVLREVGPGNLVSGNLIYHPNEISGLYASFFDDPTQLFHPYFPFGCDNQLQEVWVIDAARNLAASIWHETVPDDWPEEEWIECDRWFAQYIQPEL